VNQRWEYSGMDCYEDCLDKNHFKNYPYHVEYQYNSRGFRDQEWPDTPEELKNAIWCVGDSFTVGLGSPVEHTWPWLLQKQTERRVINISMDGASNNWIARKTINILQKINPYYIVIHWSYLHRREADSTILSNLLWNNFYQAIKDPSWPECRTMQEVNNLPTKIRHEILTCHSPLPTISDEALRLQYLPDTTIDDDLITTIDCINAVSQASLDTKIIQSFIPEFCQKPQKIQQHLAQHQINFIPEFSRLDLARDGHHYDIKTSQYFVNLIVAQLVGEHSTVL
jgi:hypothetical protein